MSYLPSAVSALIQASHHRDGRLEEHLNLRGNNGLSYCHYDERSSSAPPLRQFLDWLSGPKDVKKVRQAITAISCESFAAIDTSFSICSREAADPWRWFGRWLAFQLDAGEMAFRYLQEHHPRVASSELLSQMQLANRLSALARQYLEVLVVDSYTHIGLLPWERLKKIAKGQEKGATQAFDEHCVTEFFRHLSVVKGDVHVIDLIASIWSIVQDETPLKTLKGYERLIRWINERECRWLLAAFSADEIAMQWSCPPPLAMAPSQSVIQHPRGTLSLIQALTFEEERAIPAPDILSLGPLVNWVGCRFIEFSLEAWRQQWLSSEAAITPELQSLVKTLSAKCAEKLMPDWSVFKKVPLGFSSGQLVALDVVPWIPLHLPQFEQYFWDLCSKKSESIAHYECLIEASQWHKLAEYQKLIGLYEQLMAQKGVIDASMIESVEGSEDYARLNQMQRCVDSYFLLLPPDMSENDAIKYGVQAIRQSSAQKRPLRAKVEEWRDYAVSAKLDAAHKPAAGAAASSKGEEMGVAASAIPLEIEVALQDPHTLELLQEYLQKIKSDGAIKAAV